MPLTSTDLLRKREHSQNSQAVSLYRALPVLAEGPADRGVERFGDRAPRPPEGALPL